MSEYNSRLIEDHPSESLHRIRSLLLLYMSVEWDGCMVGAKEGESVLLDEVVCALAHVIEQVTEYQREVES